MKKIIKWFKQKTLNIFKKMANNCYDVDDARELTDYLKAHVFPTSASSISFPIEIDNMLNSVAYSISFRGLTLTLKVEYEYPSVKLIFVETNFREFTELTSLLHYINSHFDTNRMAIADKFNNLKEMKEEVDKIMGE